MKNNHLLVSGTPPPRILALMSAADRANFLPAPVVTEADRATAARAEYRQEQKIQREIVGYLATREIECWCQRMDRKSNVKTGLPDIALAYRGRALAWEVKPPGGKPEPHQERMHARLRAPVCGWLVSIVRSVEEAAQILKAIDFMIQTAP